MTRRTSLHPRERRGWLVPVTLCPSARSLALTQRSSKKRFSSKMSYHSMLHKVKISGASQGQRLVSGRALKTKSSAGMVRWVHIKQTVREGYIILVNVSTFVGDCFSAVGPRPTAEDPSSAHSVGGQ
ncbi:hypothetical protein MPTK1_8g00670 [Marchantia polymorpha subsp. ruderalis]|uniref:Uncharacterized protein n=1 Tax=Marchantia polymorpha TaxID=3197 RepID=A0A2R6WLF5_MARPO|nr:hypothetical protein MARPO_0077s0008 [Marchantia polymorpha]BBN18212.1 hypothetical protein Mp_8g00670 [Marchantia polymorpha subsp. ruderalis]|eukprot:PTQ34675.1 hypothetical protein MARPO_0077s0008 [Marchantia polymorpha]